MKKSFLISLISNCLLTFVTSLSLFVGLSLVFSDYEKTSYLNAGEYAATSAPYKNLLFEYKPNISIKNEAKVNFK